MIGRAHAQSRAERRAARAAEQKLRIVAEVEKALGDRVICPSCGCTYASYDACTSPRAECPGFIAIDLAYRRAHAEAFGIRHCRVCVCTDNRACAGGCYWVAPDLCSACLPERRCEAVAP